MKKILYLGGFELPDKNAAAQRVMTNALMFREIGYDVSFVGYTKDDNVFHGVIRGFDCELLPYPKSYREWVKHAVSFVDSNIFEKKKYDYIILYNFPVIASLRIVKYCKKNDIKVIHDLTEWEDTLGVSLRALMKKIDVFFLMHHVLYKMDGIIAISRYLYNYYRERVHTILIPPTVDLKDKKWSREREIRVCSKKIKIVFAGSAGPLKDRLDIVLKSFGRFEKLELVVIGTTIEQYKERFGVLPEIHSNVKFIGLLSHIDVLKHLSEADFQIIIRNNNRKTDAGFPTKFVESLSCGVPVIATLTSNIGDYLKDGVNGFIVDEKHPLPMVLEWISSMKEEDIIEMKNNCLNMNDFDYREYIPQVKMFLDSL